MIYPKEESSYLSTRAEHWLAAPALSSTAGRVPALQEHMACEIEEGKSLAVALRDLRTEPLESQSPYHLRFTHYQ